MSTKCYWFIILILSLESDYQMVPRRQQDYFKDNNMVLENSKVEPSLAFKNSLSVSKSDTQEFSLSSSLLNLLWRLKILNQFQTLIQRNFLCLQAL